jgi:hypothetical protein
MDLDPIFDSKTWDTPKLAQIIRHEPCAETDRVCSDQ